MTQRMKRVEHNEHGEKLCSACRQWKAITDYTKHTQTWDGLHPICRWCFNAHRIELNRMKGIRPKDVVRTSETKRCAECHLWKPYSSFSSDASNKDGFAHRCSECDAERARRYRGTKPKGWAAQQSRHMYHSSIQRKLRQLLKNRIWWALQGGPKTAHTLELLGCTVDELKAHLERQFQPGMTWDNYSYRGWHIDHIAPCSVFDLTDPEQQRICFNYNNLQPLWAKDNMQKSGPRRK